MRKVYFVYAPKGASKEEVRKRCIDFKRRQDAADARVERDRIKSPVFVPTPREFTQIMNKYRHRQWMRERGLLK